MKIFMSTFTKEQMIAIYNELDEENKLLKDRVMELEAYMETHKADMEAIEEIKKAISHFD